MQTEMWDGASEARWYLAYTAARRESMALEHLSRQGYEAYLPLFGRVEPMFPRYLFFRPRDAAQSIAPVRSTRGVQAVVRFGVLYARVSDALISAIREQEMRLKNTVGAAQSPRAGQRIRVKDDVAVFAGLEGLVQASADRRVIVLMEILGRQTPVSMRVENIEIV